MSFIRVFLALTAASVVFGCKANVKNEQSPQASQTHTKTNDLDDVLRARPVREFLPNGERRVATGSYYLFFLAGGEFVNSDRVVKTLAAICDHSDPSTEANKQERRHTRVITPVRTMVAEGARIDEIVYDFDRADEWIESVAASAPDGSELKTLGAGTIGFLGNRTNTLSLLDAGASSDDLEQAIIRNEFVFVDLKSIKPELIRPVVRRVLNRTKEREIADNESFMSAIAAFTNLANIGRSVIELVGPSQAVAADEGDVGAAICSGEN